MGDKWDNGPRHRNYGPALESKPERRARILAEKQREIDQLRYAVTAAQRAASTAIRLLQPYAAADRKPLTSLRRTFERTGKT